MSQALTSFRPRFRSAALPLLAPVAFAVLTACSGKEKVDEQLKADLSAASMAPGARQQFASPQELAYGQGYAPNYQPGYGAYMPQPYPQNAQYPQQYGYPQPQQQTRVVYVPQRTTSRSAGTSSGSGSGVYSGPVQQAERRNTQKGAIIGAVAGTAIGVATSRDRVKGGAIGALGGAVLGGVIGHQIKTPR
ncbi:MAG: YMGG-like glycine zipper-containing protein [Gemmatimonadota bacterium]